MRTISLESLPGNAEEYSMNHLCEMEDSPLKGKNVLFLGSSVTHGAASLQEAIPEFFAIRMGCYITKEAVCGTTLSDIGELSYVQRLRNLVSIKTPYSLVVVQLSTNDATLNLPLGEISESMNLSNYDTKTITGAIEFIITYVKKTWACPIAFYTGSRYDSAAYAKMVQRLKELQVKWGIGILDLWSDSHFNELSATKRKLYMDDDIHPTKAGYRDWWCPELERQLCKWLDSLS